MKKLAKYGLIVGVFVLIAVIVFYYRDYLPINRDVRASPDEGGEQIISTVEKCKLLSSSCSGMVKPTTSKGETNEASARQNTINLCNEKVTTKNTEKENCLIELRNNLESCKSDPACEVVGLVEEDTLNSCTISNSWPCVETALNPDGTVTVCVSYTDPYKKECSNPRERQDSDIIGWSCPAKSGKYNYEFNCQAKV